MSRAVSCQAATSRARSTEPAQSMAPRQAKPKQSQQSLPGDTRACQIPWATRHSAHGAGSQRAQGAEQSELYCRVHSWLASLQPNAAAAAGREGSRDAEIKLAHGLFSQAWRWKALREQERVLSRLPEGPGDGINPSPGTLHCTVLLTFDFPLALPQYFQLMGNMSSVLSKPALQGRGVPGSSSPGLDHGGRV